MTKPASYEPVFAYVPDDVLARWELIREFIRRWHGIPLPPVNPHYTPLLELPLPDYVLPRSLLQWLSLVDDLGNRLDPVLGAQSGWRVPIGGRVEAVPGFCFLSGPSFRYDEAWATAAADRFSDDPQVHLFWSFEDGPGFLPSRDAQRTLSSLILWKLMSVSDGRFPTVIKSTPSLKLNQAFVQELKEWYEVVSPWDDLLILESQNLCGVIGEMTGGGQNMLCLKYWKMVKEFPELPECIRKIEVRRPG